MGGTKLETDQKRNVEMREGIETRDRKGKIERY